MTTKFAGLEALIDSILDGEGASTLTVADLINILGQPHTCSRFLLERF